MSRDAPNRRRSKQIKFYVNDVEFQMINDRMRFCNCTNYGEYARKMMIDGWIFAFRNEQEIRKLTYEINKIGTNINQIAHVANLSESVDEKSINDLKEMMGIIWQYLRYILSATQS